MFRAAEPGLGRGRVKQSIRSGSSHDFLSAITPRNPTTTLWVCLVDISVFRVIIPEPSNLIRCLALDNVVPLTTVSLLVLRAQQHRRDTPEDARHEDEPEGSSVPEREGGTVLGAVEESGIDAGAVPEGHYMRYRYVVISSMDLFLGRGKGEEGGRQERLTACSLACGPLEMAREVVGHPRDGDPDGDVEPRGHNDTASVLSTGAVTRSAEQDGISGAGGDAAADGKDAPPARPVGEVGDAEVGDGAGGVAGDGEQLGVDAAVAQGVDDGREERAEAVEHDRDAVLGDGNGPDLPVLEGRQHLLPVDAVRLALEPQVRAVQVEPEGAELLLPVCEVRGALGVVGEHKVRRDAEEDGRDALEDHQPPPRREPLNAVHEPNGIRQQPAR